MSYRATHDRSAYDRLYHSINAEARNEYVREWRAANADKVRAYRDENRDKRLAQARAGRYRRRIAFHLRETEEVYSLWHSLTGQGDRSPAVDARDLMAEWEAANVANTCGNGCGRGWRAIVHSTPLYEGGEHTLANLRPVCGKPTCSPAGATPVATATDRPNT
ncbi:HNH endonuclease [Streptomyces phage Shady]|uniref:HNH endonuclease n=1 Tax=Streptomyces phage Shady TaxID=2767585 RepID=A0A873WE87_9CAUD|nr:HNH endonuclease [Streptomyces phage Shady]